MWRLATDRGFFDWLLLMLGLAAIIGGASVVFLHTRQKSIDTIKQETIDAQAFRIKQLVEENEALRTIIDKRGPQ